MLVATNMAWPDDPYGTGQLWRKEPLLAVGFALQRKVDNGQTWPISYAVTYLRLHRTQAIDLSPGVSFGFRAVTIETRTEMLHMLRLFDLDAMRARRLAKLVAAWRLADDLGLIGATFGEDAGRGIHSLAESWQDRDRGAPALANMIDLAYDRTPQADDLITAAASSDMEVPSMGQACDSPAHLEMPLAAAPVEHLAACSTVRALLCALTAGRILDRFTWEGPLDVSAAMAANAGDCFPSQSFTNQVRSA
jgi:hypothetical protein